MFLVIFIVFLRQFYLYLGVVLAVQVLVRQQSLERWNDRKIEVEGLESSMSQIEALQIATQWWLNPRAPGCQPLQYRHEELSAGKIGHVSAPGRFKGKNLAAIVKGFKGGWDYSMRHNEGKPFEKGNGKGKGQGSRAWSDSGKSQKSARSSATEGPLSEVSDSSTEPKLVDVNPAEVWD